MKECAVCSKPSSKFCKSCKARFYCSQECQIADWKEHKKFCPKVEEKQISVVKGRGLVATRNINAGEFLTD